MAKKISQLPDATTPLAGTELVELVQAAHSRKTTVALLLAGAPVTSVAGLVGIISSGNLRTALSINNLDNTSDANKPISAATATALSNKADLSGGKLLQSQLPDIAIVDFLGTKANQAAMLATTGQKGDWIIRTDTGTNWVITGTDPTQLSSWTQLSYPGAPVTSVAGRTGAITLTAADIGAGTFPGNLIFTGNTTFNGTFIANGGGTILEAWQFNGGFDVFDAVVGFANSTSGVAATVHPAGTTWTVDTDIYFPKDQSGTFALVPGTGNVTGLATIVGSNFFTLANPSAITFPKINADNTVSTESAATYRTSLGVGFTGKLVWVDPVNGVDGTGVRGRQDKPFATLTAAQNAAISGDTVVALPGTYSEYGLGKDGVNWYGMVGAKINVTTTGSTALRYIFGDTSSTAKSFSIDGFFEIVNQDLTSTNYFFGIYARKAASKIVFRGRSIKTIVDGNVGTGYGVRAISGATIEVYLTGNLHGSLWAASIDDAGVAATQIVVANSITTDAGGDGCACESGTQYVTAQTLGSVGALGAAFIIDGKQIVQAGEILAPLLATSNTSGVQIVTGASVKAGVISNSIGSTQTLIACTLDTSANSGINAVEAAGTVNLVDCWVKSHASKVDLRNTGSGTINVTGGRGSNANGTYTSSGTVTYVGLSLRKDANLSDLTSPSIGRQNLGTYFSKHVAKSADFSVTAADAGTVFDVTTGASAIVVTLDTAANLGTNFQCLIRKIDSGSGTVVANSQLIGKINHWIEVDSDGTTVRSKTIQGGFDTSGNYSLTSIGSITLTAAPNQNIALALSGTGIVTVSGMVQASYLRLNATGQLSFADGSGGYAASQFWASGGLAGLEINNGTPGTYRDLRARNLIASKIIAPSDSTTAIQITKADGTTAVGTWDTTNSALRLGASSLSNSQVRLLVGDGGSGSTPVVFAIDAGTGTSSGGSNAQVSFYRGGVFQGVFGLAGGTDSLINGAVSNDFAFRTNTHNILFSTDNGTTAGMKLDTSSNLTVNNNVTVTAVLNVSQALGGALGIHFGGQGWLNSNGGGEFVFSNNAQSANANLSVGNLTASGGTLNLSTTPKIQWPLDATSAFTDTLNLSPTGTNKNAEVVIHPSGTATNSVLYLSAASTPDTAGTKTFGFGGGFSGAVSNAWNFGSFVLAQATTASWPIVFVTSDSTGRHEALRIQPSGGVSIGTTTDPGVGNIVASNFYQSVSGSTGLIGANLRFNSGSTGFNFLNSNGSVVITSGTMNAWRFNGANGGFAPTSGTGVYNELLIDTTINQTGGASGIARGIYINPTLTAAADYRAIEVVSGKVVLGGGAFISGLVIGDTTSANAAATGQIKVYDSVGGTFCAFIRGSAGKGEFDISSTGAFFARTGDIAAGTRDTAFSRYAAGVWQFGTTTANDSGSWRATNGTLLGTLVVTGASTFGTINKWTFTAPTTAATLVAGADNLTYTFPSITDTLVGRTTTDTLTNKRVTRRVFAEASNATPTPDADSYDQHNITALAAAITSVAAPAGTPTPGQQFTMRIKDNGTARAIAGWNAIYRAGSDVALPTTTVISKTMYLGFIYNSTDSKWDLVALVNNI